MQQEETAKEAVDYDKLGELLNTMKMAMDDMDIDLADEIIEQLNDFCYPDDMLPNIEKLRTAVTNIEAEQVKECVETIEKQMQE